MLYIHETPLHFGLILISWIILLLGVFYTFADTNTKEKRISKPWLTFSTGVFLFFTFTILLIRTYLLPATATTDQLLPYFMALWSCYALYGFFAIFSVLSADQFQGRLWLRYLFLLGTISFLALLWLLATPASIFLVFDGAMNWLAMPLILIAYGGILWIVYLVLFPFLLVYQVNKQRTHPIKTTNWLYWFAGLLVDIGALLIALVFFLAPYTLIALGIITTGAIIYLITAIFYFLTKPSTPTT